MAKNGDKVDDDELSAADGAGGDAATEPGPARRFPFSLLVLIAALLIGAYFGYREFQERLVFLHEEDARIHAEMITISSRVAGWITKVAAKEGQAVNAETPLVVIDSREAELVLDELTARADGIGAEKQRLNAERLLVEKQTQSKLEAERSELAAARVVVSSLSPQLNLAKRELERTRRLFDQKVASRRQLDQAETQLQRIEREHSIAVAKLKGASARVTQAQAEQNRLQVLAGDLEVLVQRQAEIEARIRRQRLDMRDRIIGSPVDGVVDKTFVDTGEYVTPGQRLMLVHDPDNIWIEANIKETEISRLKPGQKVQVSVDAYPEEAFAGTVEQIGNTATSAFALLPSPNPSGNFTKITQRLPVRIAIEQRDGRLRPGMMVEVKIETSQ